MNNDYESCIHWEFEAEIAAVHVFTESLLCSQCKVTPRRVYNGHFSFLIGQSRDIVYVLSNFPAGAYRPLFSSANEAKESVFVLGNMGYFIQSVRRAHLICFFDPVGNKPCKLEFSFSID